MLVCQASLVEKWLVLLPYSERVAGLIPVTVDCGCKCVSVGLNRRS